MKKSNAVVTLNYDEPSLKKELLLDQFADGRIGGETLTSEMRRIAPPIQKPKVPYLIFMFIVTVITAIFIPPNLRQNEN